MSRDYKEMLMSVQGCALRRCVLVLVASVGGGALAASPALAATPPTVTTGSATTVKAACHSNSFQENFTGTVTVPADTDASTTYKAFFEYNDGSDHWATAVPNSDPGPGVYPEKALDIILTTGKTYQFRLVVSTDVTAVGYTEMPAGTIWYGAWQSFVPQCGPSGGGSASTDVSQALGVSGATITSILSSGGYTATVTVPGPGALTITWVPAGATIASATPVVIAKGTKTFTKAGSSKLKIKLTSKGKALLKKSKHLKLTAVGTFKPTTGSAVTKHKTFALKR